MEPITIAMAKGRLADETLTLLENMGVDVSALKEKSRKLVFYSGDHSYRFIMVKPSDVPTYVDHGVADVGIVGKDTLMEENRPLYEMLDLGFGTCRICIAGYAEKEPLKNAHIRVATKYTGIASQVFSTRGSSIEIIKLNGSVELGPVIGLSDVILDIVESGATLHANGLSILEEICTCSARLVVNRVSLKTKESQIRPLIEGLKEQIEKRSNDHD